MSRLRRLLAPLRLGRRRPRFDPPTVERDLVQHLFHINHGLPQIDWNAAEQWCRDHGSVPLCAVAAAWLDELRDSLEGEYWRWRHQRIEGLAPAEDGLAQRIERAGDTSLAEIEQALRPIRGRSPVPELAIIALATRDDYYSFFAHYDPGEGESATSAGCYIHPGDHALPMIVLHTQARWGIENTIAHELTHHALHEYGLPRWVEEGFTQMLEERITGVTSFRLDHEMVMRQRQRWADGLDDFISGSAFLSPVGDDQELTYHLAEWIARTSLSDQPEAYFAFARDCRRLGADRAAEVHLGCRLEDFIRRLIEA